MDINDKPVCYVFDLDGTVTDRKYIPEYDKEVNFENEYCQDFVCSILEILTVHYKVIILTGRSNIYFEETLKWLNDRGLHPTGLVMRSPSDGVKGIDYKLNELKKLEEVYRIAAIFEDRVKYVKAFRSAGYKVLDVAGNNF